MVHFVGQHFVALVIAAMLFFMAFMIFVSVTDRDPPGSSDKG
jgi:hypothetical protein